MRRIALSEARTRESRTLSQRAAAAAMAKQQQQQQHEQRQAVAPIAREARATLMRQLSVIWFPGTQRPVAGVAMLEHVTCEMLRSAADAVSDAVFAHALPGKTNNDDNADKPLRRVQEACEPLEQRLSLLLDVWEPREVVA